MTETVRPSSDDAGAPESIDERWRKAQWMEAIGGLACGLAHDFNNALAVVIGQAQLLEAKGALDPASTARVEKIVQAGCRAAALSSQLIHLAHQSNTKTEPLAVGGLLKSSVRLLAAAYRDRATFSLIAPDPSPLLRVSALEFHQILLNLCQTALDSAEPGGVIEIRLEAVSGGATNGGLALVVEAASAKSPPASYCACSGDSSIPLALTADILRSVGGCLEAGGTMGGAARYRAVFPVVAVAGGAPSGKTGDGRGELVLVGEGRPDIAEILCRQLANHGYRSRSIADLDELRDFFDAQGSPPDAALLDAAMAERSRASMMAMLRAKRPGIRIVVLTAGGRTPEVESLLDDGQAHAVLEKPFTKARLLSCLNDALEPLRARSSCPLENPTGTGVSHSE